MSSIERINNQEIAIQTQEINMSGLTSGSYGAPPRDENEADDHEMQQAGPSNPTNPPNPLDTAGVTLSE